MFVRNPRHEKDKNCVEALLAKNRKMLGHAAEVAMFLKCYLDHSTFLGKLKPACAIFYKGTCITCQPLYMIVSPSS